MVTQSPFQFLEVVLRNLKPGVLPDLSPPGWAVDEVQRRIVLLLNHVLQQEKEAVHRISRQKGRIVLVKWRFFAIKVIATPAGLLDLAAPDSTPDLTLLATQESPWAIAQAVLGGDKPAVRIDGDVQLAAEVNWLADHVRWDLEDDLARIVGDVPAHALGMAARSAGDALRQFIGKTAGKNTVGGAPA
jgi:ubiquinone biosynthesis protein UbiJ